MTWQQDKARVTVEWRGEMVAIEVSNPNLPGEAIDPSPTPDAYPCPECRERGFMPRVWQSDCPECYGGDEYGQGVYCASCEYCCGC